MTSIEARLHREPGGLHWQIGDDGKLILGVQGHPKGRGAHYHAPDILTPQRYGQWLHLAATGVWLECDAVVRENASAVRRERRGEGGLAAAGRTGKRERAKAGNVNGARMQHHPPTAAQRERDMVFAKLGGRTAGR